MYVISTAIIIIINKINALNHMVFYQFIDTQKKTKNFTKCNSRQNTRQRVSHKTTTRSTFTTSLKYSMSPITYPLLTLIS